MEKLGWSVSQVKMAKTNNVNQKLYGKHMVQFFHPDLVINDENGKAEAYPQILIINNHRGWGKLRIEVGVFRLVCENGLIVKDREMGSYTLRHMGYSFEELRTLVDTVVSNLQGVVTKINKFTERIMTKEEQIIFARKALAIRFGEDKVATPDQIKDMLSPRRNEDKGDDLYRVFNRVQEAVIRGGFDMAATTKKGTKKVRRISNMLKDLDVNGELWVLAEEFAEPVTV